jgi:hypothetical protein
MFLLHVLRNLAVLLILAVAILVATPRSSAARFCGRTCGRGYSCPKSCSCYGASTRGVCLPTFA